MGRCLALCACALAARVGSDSLADGLIPSVEVATRKVVPNFPSFGELHQKLFAAPADNASHVILTFSNLYNILADFEEEKWQALLTAGRVNVSNVKRMFDTAPNLLIFFIRARFVTTVERDCISNPTRTCCQRMRFL